MITEEPKWKLEKFKYTKCTALNIADVSTRLFYKFGHTIRDKYMAECKLVEVNGDKATVYFGNDPKATMTDKISKFFSVNVC